MAAAAGNSHCIEQFEEVKAEFFKQSLRSTMLRL